MPDLINGLFELLGAVAIFGHVRRLLIDRHVAGVSIPATFLFASWGFWNLFYYPHLGQWWSTAGAVAIVTGNVVWIVLMIHYTRHPGGRKVPDCYRD